jgi:membrane-bound lytic murein transglycosylase D
LSVPAGKGFSIRRLTAESMDCGIKLFLKTILVILITCLVAGCSLGRKSISSSPGSEPTSVTSSEPDEDFDKSPTPASEETAGTGRVEPGSPNALRAHVLRESQPIREEDIPRKPITLEESESDSETPEKGTKNAQQILDEALEFCETSQEFWGRGDFENGMAALDQAYSLLLGVETNDDPELGQQKEDIRFMICKRMLEIYASRYTVAGGNHNAIPLVMNQYVEREIRLFQDKENDFFLAAYERSGRYRPEMVRAFREAGLPEELSWLPLIESGFKARALSPARALGLWQFIPSTGYKYGLNRDEWIDERMDVTKSTRAAIDYMTELHSMFGDWMTVLAAYNCGEARVLQVIRSQNINYLDNFWDLFEKLPYETARYVPRFLATLHIIGNPEKFGMRLGEVAPPESYERVEVSKRMRLQDMAKTMELPPTSLEELNPELRYKVTPPSSYELKVPQERGRILIARIDQIPDYTPPETQYIYHQVKRGETLSQIAARHRTSVHAITSANRISTKSVIRVGQTLKVPTKGFVPQAYVGETKSVRVPESKPTRYRVTRGDSLWLLAGKYNTNIKEIMSANHLKTGRLHVGQVLLIPKGTTTVATGSPTKTYRVRNGDSPFKIAQSHSMKLDHFLRINDLTPRSKIYPGQLLLVEVR